MSLASQVNSLAAAMGAALAAKANRTDVVIPATFTYSGSLAVLTGQARFYNDTGRTLTIRSTRASLGTAPAGQAVMVDVNLNGATIFTTPARRPTVAAGSTAVKVTNPDVTAWPDGSYLTVDIDAIGSTVAGSDLSVVVTAS